MQNLTKKHQAVVAEINNHEPRIKAVLRDADDLVTEGHFASEEVRSRAAQLTDQWDQLKEKAAQRRQDLDASLAAHQVRGGGGEERVADGGTGTVGWGGGGFGGTERRNAFLTLEGN